ncbi:MAG: hypothetical protein IPG96_00705 [Proteobacteria bacterium]|nr:hypothetical protein [Pseudomonadota bacterium]
MPEHFNTTPALVEIAAEGSWADYAIRPVVLNEAKLFADGNHRVNSALEAARRSRPSSPDVVLPCIVHATEGPVPDWRADASVRTRYRCVEGFQYTHSREDTSRLIATLDPNGVFRPADRPLAGILEYLETVAVPGRPARAPTARPTAAGILGQSALNWDAHARITSISSRNRGFPGEIVAEDYLLFAVRNLRPQAHTWYEAMDNARIEATRDLDLSAPISSFGVPVSNADEIELTLTFVHGDRPAHHQHH